MVLEAEALSCSVHGENLRGASAVSTHQTCNPRGAFSFYGDSVESSRTTDLFYFGFLEPDIPNKWVMGVLEKTSDHTATGALREEPLGASPRNANGRRLG